MIAYNERITELLIQAGGKVDYAGVVDYEQLDHEQFAELIIRECCSKVTANEALNIKEHFGVR